MDERKKWALFIPIMICIFALAFSATAIAQIYDFVANPSEPVLATYVGAGCNDTSARWKYAITSDRYTYQDGQIKRNICVSGQLIPSFPKPGEMKLVVLTDERRGAGVVYSTYWWFPWVIVSALPALFAWAALGLILYHIRKYHKHK